jgi:hypothetical protein
MSYFILSSVEILLLFSDYGRSVSSIVGGVCLNLEPKPSMLRCYRKNPKKITLLSRLDLPVL